MDRRNFLVAIATATTTAKAVADSISVPVNIDAWNKFLESDCDEMVWHEATQTWHRMYKVDLTNKKGAEVSNTSFCKTLSPKWVRVMHRYEQAHFLTIPIRNQKFTVKEKQDLLDYLIKNNKGHKVFMAQINVGEAANIYGWAE